MPENLFSLSEERFERLMPLLSDNNRGVAQVDVRRVISEIVHVLKSGCRYAISPLKYGPRKTLYNGWRRWPTKVAPFSAAQPRAVKGEPSEPLAIRAAGQPQKSVRSRTVFAAPSALP